MSVAFLARIEGNAQPKLPHLGWGDVGRAAEDLQGAEDSGAEGSPGEREGSNRAESKGCSWQSVTTTVSPLIFLTFFFYHLK